MSNAVKELMLDAYCILRTQKRTPKHTWTKDGCVCAGGAVALAGGTPIGQIMSASVYGARGGAGALVIEALDRAAEEVFGKTAAGDPHTMFTVNDFKGLPGVLKIYDRALATA